MFVGPFAEVNLPEIGRKFGLLVTPTGDVLVRSDNLAPRLQASRHLTFSMAVPALFRFSLRICSSKIRRRSSIFILPTSSACDAETAVRRRAIESRAPSASSPENGSDAPSDSHSHELRRRDHAQPAQGLARNTSFQPSHISFNSSACCHCVMGLFGETIGSSAIACTAETDWPFFRRS